MHRAIAPWLLNWLTHHDARGSVTGGPAVLESTFICNILRILREGAHVRAFHDILIFFFRQCFIKESKKKDDKGKAYPTTCHESTGREQRYSSTLCLSSARDGVGG